MRVVRDHVAWANGALNLLEDLDELWGYFLYSACAEVIWK